MTDKSPRKAKLILVSNRGLGGIAIDMEAFFGFSFAMAEELRSLERNWAHYAVTAQRPVPTSNRRPKEPFSET